jgi:hypothetical protein
VKDPLTGLEFDEVHRACRCKMCCELRVIRMLRDLEIEYGPDTDSETEIDTPKDTIQ